MLDLTINLRRCHKELGEALTRETQLKVNLEFLENEIHFLFLGNLLVRYAAALENVIL